MGGNTELWARIQESLLQRGASDVQVTPCGCLGPCFDGPTAVIYPEGVWYGALEPADAEGLVEHLVDGRPYSARVIEPPGSIT